jgi:hypothetical protein
VGAVVTIGWALFWSLLIFGTFKYIDSKRAKPLFIFRDETTFETLVFGAPTPGTSIMPFPKSFDLSDFQPTGSGNYIINTTNNSEEEVRSSSDGLMTNQPTETANQDNELP